MKNIYLLIFFLILVSCQTNKLRSRTFYKKGIKIVENNNSHKTNDYSDALNYFNKSVKLNPINIESSYWKMTCEIKLGQLDSALLTAKSAINNLKNYDHELTPKIYITAGLLEKKNNNIALSLKDLEIANLIYSLKLKTNVNDIDAITNKAIILCYQNEKKNAILFLNTYSQNSEINKEIEQIIKKVESFDFDKEMNELFNKTN